MRVEFKDSIDDPDATRRLILGIEGKYPEPEPDVKRDRETEKKLPTPLNELSEPARAILRVCSFLASEPIPESLFLEIPTDIGLPESLIRLNDRKEYKAAAVALRKHSLVQVSDDSLLVAPELCAFLRESMSDSESRDWQLAAFKLVEAAFQFDELDLDTWKPAHPLLPHVWIVTSSAAAEMFPDIASDLLAAARRLSGLIGGANTPFRFEDALIGSSSLNEVSDDDVGTAESDVELPDLVTLAYRLVAARQALPRLLEHWDAEGLVEGARRLCPDSSRPLVDADEKLRETLRDLQPPVIWNEWVRRAHQHQIELLRQEVQR